MKPKETNVKRILIAAAFLSLGLAASRNAEARNPHCAGGIQYLTQWRADKEKGNLDDYRRELAKSIQQLEVCSTEDPKDFEAIGYLGWAYAEADSAAAAGRAFQQAIEGLQTKNDKKNIEIVTSNRKSYWAGKFNDGVAKIKTANEIYPEYCKKPASADEEKSKADATKKFDEALVSFNKALALMPGDTQTMKNIATVHAMRCDYPQAAKVLQEGLAMAPGDSEMVKMMRQVRGNMASDLISSKNYDEAIKFYSDLLKTDPQNVADHSMGLGEAYFERAQAKEGDARAADFKAAGDAYAKAAELRKDPDLWYNAATAYQNGGEYPKAENAWRARLVIKPDDTKAMIEMGSVLSDEKKFDEAIKVLHQAVLIDPKDKNTHRQLGAVYTKAGNNQKGTEELMVYLTLQNGQPTADPAADAKKAPAGSAAAKTAASAGTPEQVYLWTADSQKWETWFYWTKRVAYHFQAGALAQKSDWSAPDLKTANSGK